MCGWQLALLHIGMVVNYGINKIKYFKINYHNDASI